MNDIDWQLDEAYRNGGWDAFAQVLNYLNTIDMKVVDKKDIYHAVFAMRPKQRGINYDD